MVPPEVDGAARPRVAYVLKKFPRLSETFILNELLGLEEAGVDVSVLSLRMPDDGRFHADLARLQGQVRYVPEPKSAAVFEAFRVVAGSGEAAASALDRAVAFLEMLPESRRTSLLVQGLHVAREVRESGLQHLHAHFATIASHVAYIAHCITGVSYSVTAHAKDIFRHDVNRDVFRTIAGAAATIVTVRVQSNEK